MTTTTRISIIMSLVAVLAIVGTASAHVALVAPNGGETAQAGAFLPITWRVVVGHPMTGWDLWYSTVSREGPWIEIALNLPVGDTALGSTHHHDWIVPDMAAPSVWVRRFQGVARISPMSHSSSATSTSHWYAS